MNSSSAVTVLAALAHEGRLNVFRMLIRRLPGRVSPGELVAELALGPSLVSAYLRTLDQAGLLDCERQGRSLRYRAELGALGSLTGFLLEDCCRGRVDVQLGALAGRCTSAKRPPGDKRAHFVVLFIDRTNAGASLMAQSVLGAHGTACCSALSAGIAPASRAVPGTFQALRSAGYEVSGLRPRSLNKILASGNPAPDIVITLSAEVANAVIPVGAGFPVTAHWDLSTMSDDGTNDCSALLAQLEQRIDVFAALLAKAHDRRSLQFAADEAGSALIVQVGGA